MLFNPLKIFFPSSIVFTLLGIIWGIVGFIIAGRFPNSAILVTMLGIFVFFIGLLADQVALQNRSSK
jgi:ABC-type dipeptide/oligopeptide/nickel transport system permease component